MKAPDGRPTIVFLHEGLGSVALWRDFPRRVAEATRAGALVYSRYGNGRSDALDAKRTVRYMHDEATLVLPEILRVLEIERPVLFGHSDGASIALIYAGAVPTGALALVLEAPHLFVEDLSVASIATMRERYEREGLRSKMLRYHRDVDATFYGWNDIWLDPAFRTWNIEESVRNVTAPVLALQGADDEYGTLAQLEALRAGSAGSVDTLVLSDCGHAPHRDRTGFVEKAVASWIAESAPY
ncbi:MAG TPA: alpha/beta hydrolase [Candidatus Baltobacteraceae bacterium]|nr:alpha/beta hydrolase [Candidatus Baltobacteraceae bacterium]